MIMRSDVLLEFTTNAPSSPVDLLPEELLFSKMITDEVKNCTFIIFSGDKSNSSFNWSVKGTLVPQLATINRIAKKTKLLIGIFFTNVRICLKILSVSLQNQCR